MTLIGLAALGGGLRYRVGTLERMGPGFFPAAVGAILALVGVAIVLSAERAPGAPSVPARPEWRGWGCIAGGILAFIVLGAHGGLIPATFAIVFISALGDRRNTPGQAFWLALAMVAIAVVVFKRALHLGLPLFAWS